VAWSPDGKSLTYKSGGATWRVTAEGMEAKAPEKTSAIASGPRENSGGHIQLTQGGGTRDFSPHISPDRKWLVYASAPAGTPAGKDCDLEIKLAPVVNGNPDLGKALTMAKPYGGADALDFDPWSPDSKNFAFVSRQPGK
jgi:Tol biopolymer transport system component